MLTRPGLLDALETGGWLSETPASFRKDVLSRCALRSFGRGETVYRIGDDAGGLYGVVTGALTIEIAADDGGPSPAFLVGPGFWVGAGSLFTRRTRKLGVRAAEASTLAHFPLAACDAMTAADPGAWRWFGLLPLANLQSTLGVIDDLLIRDSGARTAAVLLRLGGARGPTPGKEPVEVGVSQEELARMTNLARTTIVRILSEFSEAGLIDTCYRRLRIRNPQGLAALVQR